ncbi:MAG: DUF2029 domain-containing protein [Dehalococcoidia bacterium]|nr:DUF2029 domain-containing protein [Dehalococcoidia bacterium]
MIATELRARDALPTLWRAAAPVALRCALLAAIGIELAVLAAWAPDTARRFVSAVPGDWGNLYVRARDLRVMGLYSPVLTPLLFPISLAGINNGYRILFGLNVASALGIAWLAQRPLRSPEARAAAALAVVSLPQLHWAIRFGHVTPILTLAALCGLLLVQRHPRRGAVLLAAMSIKPQYAVSPFLFFVCRRQFRLLAVLLATAAAGVGIGFVFIGPGGVGEFARLYLDWGPNSTQKLLPVQQAWMYSWPGFLLSVGVEPNRLLTADLLLLSAAVAGVAFARLDAAKAAAVVPLAMILVTPYAQFYDASLIAASFALLLRCGLAPRTAGLMIASLYIAALVSQTNTNYPARDVLGAASTGGPFWLTPALLLAVAVLAICGRDSQRPPDAASSREIPLPRPVPAAVERQSVVAPGAWAIPPDPASALPTGVERRGADAAHRAVEGGGAARVRGEASRW